MADLSTKYLGLNLKSPIIASASGMTNSLADIIEIEKNGAGAVVLKSLFEEEIITEMENRMNTMLSENHLYPETMDYYEPEDVEDTLSMYLKLISDCKKAVDIPIIASINCITSYNWPYFAKTLQEAGADAIELNIAILPSDINAKSEDNEKIYFDIIDAVKKEITIPLSLKISHYFTNTANMIHRLSLAGVDGIVLFNRFYSEDIDIESFDFKPAPIFSSPNDYVLPLRWINIMSGLVKCDLSASTGVHDGNTLIKMILAGASSVQVASALYINGISHIGDMLKKLNNWMDKKELANIEQFRGMLSQAKSDNPAGFLRTQFMKYFSEK